MHVIGSSSPQNQKKLFMAYGSTSDSSSNNVPAVGRPRLYSAYLGTKRHFTQGRDNEMNMCCSVGLRFKGNGMRRAREWARKHNMMALSSVSSCVCWLYKTDVIIQNYYQRGVNWGEKREIKRERDREMERGRGSNVREQCPILAKMSTRLLFDVIMGVTSMWLIYVSGTEVATITPKDSHVFEVFVLL